MFLTCIEHLPHTSSCIQLADGIFGFLQDAADFSEAQRAQICSLYDASTTMLAEVRAKRECLRHEIAALLKGNGSASAAAPDASHKEMLEYGELFYFLSAVHIACWQKA